MDISRAPSAMWNAFASAPLLARLLFVLAVALAARSLTFDPYPFGVPRIFARQPRRPGSNGLLLLN